MEKMRVAGDRNQCAGCGLPFNSTVAFEKHRIGDFGKDRRCATEDEMRAKGMAIANSGYWVTALNPNFAPPDCGACPGDGSICKRECQHEAESPSVN